MSQNEWEMLFDLMEKATSLPRMTAEEKGQLIRQKASEFSADTVLEEFISQAIVED